MSLSERLRYELRAKAALLTDGVRVERSALVRAAVSKRQKHWLFDWDFESHVGEELPENLTLPEGTLVQIRKNSKSPYLLRAEGDTLVVEYDGQVFAEAAFVSEPAFYGEKGSDGIELAKSVQVRGQDCLAVCYSNWCGYFHTGDQCWFCNLVPTKDTYHSVPTVKKAESVGEAVAAAWNSGGYEHIIFTGGYLPGLTEEQTLEALTDSVRRHTGLDDIPGCAVPTAPTDLDAVDRLRKTGITGVSYNLEIWDPRLFEAICPGKTKAVGRDHWLAALDRAVDVFGAGNVTSSLVTGIEAKDSVLEGVDYLASRGVYAYLIVWSPNPGSRLEGHRTPTVDWYLDLNSKAVDIWESHGLPPLTTACHRCLDNGLFLDEVRVREAERAEAALTA